MTDEIDPTLARLRDETAANNAAADVAAQRRAPFAEPDDITARPADMRPAPPADPSFDLAYERQHGYAPVRPPKEGTT